MSTNGPQDICIIYEQPLVKVFVDKKSLAGTHWSLDLVLARLDASGRIMGWNVDISTSIYRPEHFTSLLGQRIALNLRAIIDFKSLMLCF